MGSGYGSFLGVALVGLLGGMRIPRARLNPAIFGDEKSEPGQSEDSRQAYLKAAEEKRRRKAEKAARISKYQTLD
jgi:hypothetical protein